MAIKRSKPSHFAVKECSLKADVKDIDSESRTVTGFYNTYNFLDSDGDVLLPGCAKRTIKNNGPKSNAVAKIKHALNHDLCTLPGKLMVLEERDVDGIQGIYFETKMADTELGNDTLTNYLEGIYDNHSIGFRYVTDKLTMIERESKGAWDKVVSNLINPEVADERTWLWTVGEIKLFEGSTVAFGANSLTPFLGMAKSMSKESIMLGLLERIGKLQKSLDKGTQTDDMMMRFEVECLQLKQVIEDIGQFLVLDEDGAAAVMRKQREREAQQRGMKKKKKEFDLNLKGFAL